uniref:Uncharacterized protein n=1 Tax=Ralstonia solanacearum TaxID=305 RepID=A0A0S4WQL9_RALSL|nr:conserved exported protein of unknown function [Ralstonia solanacearum]
MTAHRLTPTKGFLLYVCLVAAVLCVHAYALHLDEEAQADLRARTAHKQA